jgi:uncharacterized protein (DUF305 family)
VKGSVPQAAQHSQEENPPRRGWFSLTPVLTRVLIVGAIILGAAAGATLALLYLSDTSVDGTVEAGAPADDSAEAGFARDMMVHHAQAVQMAEIVRDKTKSEEIRTLAADIALTQQGQIGQMQGWLQVWGLPATSSEPAMTWMGHPTEGRMPGMASPEEIDNLQKASPEEADVLFLQLMIPHHEAAVPMAEAALENTDRPEVKRLAGAIIASQQAEIELMKGLLQARGAEPIEGESHAHDRVPQGGE